MGQELLEVEGKSKWLYKRRYYIATNSKGYSVARESNGRKHYTHAVVTTAVSIHSGKCYATFTTRLDLALRYCRRNNSYSTDTWNSEVVEAREVSSKEFRQFKKQIKKQAQEIIEALANRTASIYQLERETNDNQA